MNSLSVSMIVRDAEAWLPACLQSVRGLAQEIVIADTGSTDRTIAVAQQFGARIFRITWHNHFAEARNLALAAARGDWILSLDADEQLDAHAACGLPALLRDSQVAAYAVPIRNYVSSMGERIGDCTPTANDGLLPSSAPYPAFVEQQSVRLFRRLPEIQFIGRVHESVEPRLAELRRPLGKVDFCIHHFGFVIDQAARFKRNALYRELGRKKLEEMPTDWRAYFELGALELEQFQNFAEAHRLLARACALNAHAGEAWFFYGLTCVRMGLNDDALKALREAENCDYKTALVAETRGDAWYNLGRFDEARAAYEAALKREQHNPSAQAKVGLATVRAGSPDKGLARLRAYLAASRQAPELYEGLIASCVFLDRLREAAELADQKLRFIPDLYPGDYLRAASLQAQLREWSRAEAILVQGLSIHPRNKDLQRALNEVTQQTRVASLQSS